VNVRKSQRTYAQANQWHWPCQPIWKCDEAQESFSAMNARKLRETLNGQWVGAYYITLSTHRTSRPCIRLQMWQPTVRTRSPFSIVKSKLQTSFSLLTVRHSRDRLSLIIRTRQHTGHPHPVLSSSTAHQTHPSIFQPEPDFTKRVRNATCLVMSPPPCSNTPR
jgi:hypothetical protein